MMLSGLPGPRVPANQPTGGQAHRTARLPLSKDGPTGPSTATAFQVGDEPLGGGRVGGGAGPGRPVVFQGGTGIQQGVTDPAGLSEEHRDTEAGVPGSVDVSPG